MAGFHTTRWSLVARAAHGERAVAVKALGELCEQYWYPLYAFLRRGGRDEHDASDLVQSFCASLLAGGGLVGADAGRGAFRSYLVGALRNFLRNQERHAGAARRGGGVVTWSLAMAEHRYAAEPMDAHSPEQLFERRWALDLLARALARLRDDYAGRGKAVLLQALEPALAGDDAALRHADVALQLGSTEGAVKVALHRMRTRLGELIRDEVAQTCEDPGLVEAELKHLFAALAT